MPTFTEFLGIDLAILAYILARKTDLLSRGLLGNCGQKHHRRGMANCEGAVNVSTSSLISQSIACGADMLWDHRSPDELGMNEQEIPQMVSEVNQPCSASFRNNLIGHTGSLLVLFSPSAQ
jgi:hypothetical protein